jgi:uncharacterized membrane protein
MSRIRNILILRREQLSIIPLLLGASGLALAYWLLSTEADLLERWHASRLPWLYGVDADTARGPLSSLLAGLMTMASLMVSVTFVILTLAANQLGPRLIPTFMADRQIQTVLGLFLGTILYVLVVLRSLDGTRGVEGVPHIAVTVGSALTIVCLFALLFYVHKVARSIMVDSIVAQVARGLHRNIRDMLPDNADATERSLPHLSGPSTGTVSLGRSGYIQVVDYDALVALASREQALLQVAVRAGHFILRNGEYVVVHAERPLVPEVIKAIRSAFVVGEERTPAQDLEFGLRQLVEIALRALSAGINDPFTATAVIDRLDAALEEIFGRSLEPPVWCDEAGDARVIAQRSDAQGLTDAAFDAIRQAGSDIPAVLIRMADVLGQLAPSLGSVAMREAVERQLSKLAETAKAARLAPSDRQAIMIRVKQARAAISALREEGTIHVL